jgi:hypothetical protein
VSDSPPNPLEGLLSEFALGPSWARANAEPSKKHSHESAEREFKPRRGDDRRDDRRGDVSGGRGRERRDDRGDRGRRDEGSRRDFQKGSAPRPDFRREEIAPAEGVTVSLVPEKLAIQLICKEIHQVARVYPLFDVAQIILAERSRCRAVFEISDKKDPFYRCKIDEAIFLTKEEAMRHLLDSQWRDRFIEESTIEIDPPRGSFQSVARCGISGVLLGPPNFHAYQTEIRRVHRERFPDMPFEAYTAKIRTERGEEAINAWLDSMKTQVRWRILSEEESKARAAAEAQAAAEPAKPVESALKPAEEPKTAPVAEEIPPMDPATEAPVPEESSVSEESSAPEAEAEPEPEPEADVSEEPAAEEPAPAASEPEQKWFTDRAEFERALASELLEKVFHVTRKAKVSAAIVGKNLSPGLLARLKGTGNHHRKHPAILIPLVCKILEAEHMPVFKRKGKLYTGPARPHSLAADAVLAERPGKMVTWIRENPPAKLEGLWKAMLPEGATAPPSEFAADLFWLLQQGHILLYTDDTLVVQEQPKPQGPKKPKQPKKKAAKVAPAGNEESSAASDETSESNQDSPAPAEESPGAAPEEAEAGSEESQEIIPKAETVEPVSEAAREAIESAIAEDAQESPTAEPEENSEEKPVP